MRNLRVAALLLFAGLAVGCFLRARKTAPAAASASAPPPAAAPAQPELSKAVEALGKVSAPSRGGE